jgi:hypothetical protein
MKSTQDISGPRGLHLRRVENLMLIRWGSAGWSDLKEVEGPLKEVRSAYPAGTGILNVIATGRDDTFRQAWERLATLILGAARREINAGPVHLGTAHLFETLGIRGAAAIVLFRGMERFGRDFSKLGNKVVRTMDEASDWLHPRLQVGAVLWTRTELTEVITSFVRLHLAAGLNKPM